MTHQQEFLCWLLALPPLALLCLILGRAIVLRRIKGGLHDEERPRLKVGREDCRVVTEGEYQWLRAAGKLRCVQNISGVRLGARRF